MRRIRKIIWSFIVLATVASTLLANTPLIVCACWTGQEKKLIVPTDAKSSSCSCGSNCCPSTDHQKPCCKKPADKKTMKPTLPLPTDQPQDEQGTDPSHNEPAINSPDCQKTMAQPEVFSLNLREVTAGGVLIDFLQSPPSDQYDVLPVTFSSQVNWQAYRLPPPTDLVVALQHFLI